MGEQYGHGGQHHGRGTPECPTELHHHHDERCDPVPVRVSAVEIIDGVEVPIGKVTETTISRGALDLLHGNVSPLEERRQRARETYADTLAESAHVGGWPSAETHSKRMRLAREVAIETATRVRITDDVIAEAYPWLLPSAHDKARTALGHALRKLGFEVEQ